MVRQVIANHFYAGSSPVLCSKQQGNIMFNNEGELFNSVKVSSADLLNTLEKNLQKHQKDIKEANKNRYDDIKEYFLNKIEVMLKNEDYVMKECITFPIPKDHSEDYKKAIQMVKMSQENIIELTENQFDRLVMDNWQWKKDFIATSSLYSKQ